LIQDLLLPTLVNKSFQPLYLFAIELDTLMEVKRGKLLLFDVDGTLTKPRARVDNSMLTLLEKLREFYTLAVVGGSDFEKIRGQLGLDVLERFDYVFAENGLEAYHGKSIHVGNIKLHLGEENMKMFTNFVLRYIADLDIPQKRGTFIELRAGMYNISPIGRNCSQSEREEFEKYDQVYHVREGMIQALQKEFGHLNLTFSVGGQISFDVFPHGWDKTYCLGLIPQFEHIEFFGDKTYKGGNDHEISIHPTISKSHTVKSPEDTFELLLKLYNTHL
jgi:phosphomannomutase